MTLVMSLICATSSLAATRGATFLPPAVEGKRMWLELPAIVSTCAATFSARLCAKLGLSCSAITSAAMSDHLRFVLELINESGHIGHLDALTSLERLADVQGLQARLDVPAPGLRLEDVEVLVFGLHDVGQGNVARLVQAQVGRDDRGQRQ